MKNGGNLKEVMVRKDGKMVNKDKNVWELEIIKRLNRNNLMKERK